MNHDIHLTLTETSVFSVFMSEMRMKLNPWHVGLCCLAQYTKNPVVRRPRAAIIKIEKKTNCAFQACTARLKLTDERLLPLDGLGTRKCRTVTDAILSIVTRRLDCALPKNGIRR